MRGQARAVLAGLSLASVLSAATGPWSFSVNGVRTEGSGAALTFIAEYARNLPVEFGDTALAGKRRMLWELNPQIDVALGQEGTHQRLNARLLADVVFYRDTVIAGLPTPNSAAFFHDLPAGLVLETDGGLTNLSALLELGYRPWYQTIRRLPGVLQATEVDASLQAGYKLKLAGPDTLARFQADTVGEPANSALCRIRGHAGLDLPLVERDRVGVALVGGTDVWYDVLRKAVYYRVKGTLRLKLDRNMAFDIVFERGSGAPEFREGSQFGAGLTLQLGEN